MLADFIFEILGVPANASSEFFMYLLGGILGLILIDGIISFIIGAITSLIVRGRD